MEIQLQSNHLYIESLGCARNQVDSETMAGQLQLSGWSLVEEPAKADVIVVNTCSFVESAINESIDTILELARYKKKGRCHRLVVAGCLPERFREAIVDALPEVDQFLGTGAFTRIADAVGGELEEGKCLLPDPDRIPMNPGAARERGTRYSAYLKIAEGCSRRCTYCIIPRLRGNQKSRPADQILDEARQLIAAGAKELNLVAQDTTGYGQDQPGFPGFEALLARLADSAGATWIRFLYGHPESITDRVIETVAAHGNLCPYFDLPVQHAAAGILKKMGRHYDRQRLVELFGRIRSTVPHAVLRTTLIVGFPGETDADFQELLDFIEAVQFDHLGVFSYSDSEDLPSHGLPGHVDPKVAQMRYDEVMARQMEISADRLASQIGQTMDVLIENRSESHLFEGRTMFQAPEVDGLTFVRTQPGAPQIVVGQTISVRIVEPLEYDLIGDAR